MKKSLIKITLLLIVMVTIDACQQSDQLDNPSTDQIPPAVWQKLEALGFNVTRIPPVRFENGYRVEGDIYITDADLETQTIQDRMPQTEHYATSARVTGTPRVITIYLHPVFASVYTTALNTAMTRFNSEGLTITFIPVPSTTGADIQIRRLSASAETAGILASSGYPSSGNPYNTIFLSGILQSSYGYTANVIATTITHQLGHCIGLAHTDPNSSTACNLDPTATNPGGLQIPGTPISDPLSFMRSCQNGADLPFTLADKTALNYMY